MTKLPHPFLFHPEPIEVPKEHVKDVDEIFKWIKEQPKLLPYSRNHAYLFYHACVYNTDLTKRALQRYSEIKIKSPDVFADRDPLAPEIQQVFDLAQMVAMPKRTPEQYNILIYRLYDTDPSKVNFTHAVKVFCMFNDIRIVEDEITEGYIVVFDMKGLRFGHLTKLSIGVIRTYLAYIQDAHPARLKKIYIINTSFFINHIMAIVKPLIRGELMNLLQFSAGPASSVLPLDLLPEEYGGELDKLEVYYKKQRTDMETIYRDWLIDSGDLQEMPPAADETKSSNGKKSRKTKGKPSKSESNNNQSECGFD